MAKEHPKEIDNRLVLKDTDGTVYNLLEGPGKDSKYVLKAQKNLMEWLQITELATGLANVGKIMLMAHCGVMGHFQLELKVRERLQSVVNLCDDTVVTLIHKFFRASDSAISNMAIAYEYLTEDFEDIALETLQNVSETSKNMVIESSKLIQRFGDEAAVCNGTLNSLIESSEMAEVARELAESTCEENVQTESLYCLEHALTAFIHFRNIMQVIINFWRNIHSVCNGITRNAMIKLLDHLKKISIEERQRLWNAKALKIEAIMLYAQWIAIQQMCSTSRESLINSQRQVHMFIRQNPTKEQGKELLQRLAKELAKLDIQPPELEDAIRDD